MPFEVQDSLKDQGLAMLQRINNLTDDDREIVLRKQDIFDNTNKATKPEFDKINQNSNDL